MLKLLTLAICASLGSARSVERPTSGASGVSGLSDASGLHEYEHEVLRRPGEELTLPCRVPAERGSHVKYEWLKDEQPLLTSSKQVVAADGSLAISATTLAAEGIYRCLATTPLGVASSGPVRVRNTFMKVVKPETKKHTPVRGEPYHLDCPQPAAYPPAVVVWQVRERDAGPDSPMRPLESGRATPGPDGALYFATMTDEEARRSYLCTVTSHPSSPHHHPRPHPVLLAQHDIEELKNNTDTAVKRAVPQYLSSDMLVKEGEQLYIYCMYGGAVAPPDYRFEGVDVNGDVDPGSQRVTRHNRSRGRRLLIRRVLLADQGEYSCSVLQSDGTRATHTMRLAVISAPAFTKKAESKITVKEGRDVVLPCLAAGVPQPRVSWSHDARPLLPRARLTFKSSATGSEIRIAAVKSSDAGYYGCTAASELGNIYTETLVQVT